MVARDAAVDERDGHARARGRPPGLGRLDVRVVDAGRGPDRLARVLEAPELGESEFGGKGGAGVHRLGPVDGGVVAQLGQRTGAVAVGGDDHVDAGQAGDPAGGLDARALAHLGAVAGRELDDQRVRGGLRCVRGSRCDGAREDGEERCRGLSAFPRGIGMGTPAA